MSTLFPSTPDMRMRVPLTAWRAMRFAALAAALALIVELVVHPDTGLHLMWQVAVPLLPLLFLVAPGLWRNLCPLATANQLPRLTRITRGLVPPVWLRRHGYLIAVGLFELMMRPHSSATSSSSACGTTLFTIPISNASSAE